MAIGGNRIVVRLGLEGLKGFEEKLKKASFAMRRAGQNMKRNGEELSKMVTLPVVGIGAAAVATAAKFEKLQVSLNTLTGSAIEGEKAFKRLKELSAGTPFQLEDLVKAQNTLMGFSLSSDEAFDSVKMLGDIAAISGADMSRLSVTFGQAAAEGKVMTKDIREFINNGVPMVKLLADEMGVAESEIFDLASEGKITFDVLTSAFQRATSEGGMFADGMKKQAGTIGGLFSTLKDNVSILLADIGKAVVDAGLREMIVGVTDAARGAVAAFNELSPTTKKVIVVVAGLAAAIGPLLIVLGQAKIAMAALGFSGLPLIGMFTKMAVFVKGAAMSVGTLGLSFRTLNAIMAANPIGFVITVIATLLPLLVTLYNNFEPVKKVVDAVWFALKGLGSFIAQYFIGQIKGFLKVLSGLWKAMKGDFKEGMKEVGQAIWENNPVAAAAKSGKALADSIADSYIEQNKKRAEDYKKAQEEVMNTISEVFMKKKEGPKQTSLDQFFKDGTPTNDGGGLPPAELSAYQQKTKLVSELEAKIRDLIVANKDYTAEAKELKELRSELELINYEFDNIGTAAPKLDVAFKPLEGLPTALESATDGLDKMAVKINEISELTPGEKFKRAFEGLGDFLKEQLDVVNEWMPAIQGLFDFWGQALDNKAAKQQKQYEEEMQRIQNSTMSEKKKEEAIAKLNEKRDKQERKLAREKAKRDKAVALFNAIISVAAQVAKVVGNPILAAIVAGIGAAQIAAIAAEPLPALAEGGLAYGPTMALVGDNTGARVDPEVISPLSKLKDMMGGQQDIRLSGAFRIQGQDLVLALEEANQIRVRR